MKLKNIYLMITFAALVSVIFYYLWFPQMQTIETATVPNKEVAKLEDVDLFKWKPGTREYQDALLTKWNMRLQELQKDNSTPISFNVPAPEAFLPPKIKDSKIEPTFYGDAALNSIASVAVDEGSAFICHMLASRRDTLPPSELDALIYFAINSSFEEFRKVDAPASLKPWIELSKAQNAVYRLLSVKAAPFVSSNGVHNQEAPEEQDMIDDAKIKLAFYKSMLYDPSLEIVVESIRGIEIYANIIPEAYHELITLSKSEDRNAAKIAEAAANNVKQKILSGALPPSW
jgi:hypothetical protein